MLRDGPGRALTFFPSPGRMRDAKGALVLPGAQPTARMLLGDKGCDADRFHEALEDKGIAACIPARRGRRNPASHDRKLPKPVTGSRTSSPA
jgi:IS5 family transposase